MGKLVELTVCDTDVERTTLRPLLNAYGIYAFSPNQLARGVSYSPSSLGGYPIFVVNSDLDDARALLDDISTNTPG